MEREYNVSDEFKYIAEYNNFIYPISLKNSEGLHDKQIFFKLVPIKELANKLHTTENFVYQQLKKLMGKQFVLRDLVQYTYANDEYTKNHGVLVATNGVYIEKYDTDRQRYISIKYNVYLTANQYQSCSLNVLFRHLLIALYPHIFVRNENNHILFKDGYKYTVEQRKALLSLSNQLPVDKVPYVLHGISIAELSRCLSNKKKIDEIISKSRILTYYDSDDMYISLYDVKIGDHKYNMSLYVPIETLFTKNYADIENVKIISHPYLTENGERKFMNGLQKDLPYFKSKRAQDIIKYILQ